jgi:hypothetical protein
MDKFFLSLDKRIVIPVVAVAGFALWLFLCEAHYQSYWDQTIYRVQTTDFNLLHHTLPTTLSELIISGRDDLVQETLDSTYGIFGLVVTDPSGQSILYKTGKNWHRGSWQDKVTPENLVKEGKSEPFDILTDPPPLAPIWEHKSPRANESTRIPGANNPARRIIGHLYYVRPLPPTFLEDLQGFFTTGFAESSGAKRGYLYVTFSAILFSVVLILLFWLRQRVLASKQQELDHIHRELDIRKRALEHVTSELTSQKSRKTWLEREADESYKRALKLKIALERLRDAMAHANGVDMAPPMQSDFPPRVRPAVHPPSALLEEIEQLIPALTDNAGTLKSQANMLHDYCAILEQQQSEMKRIVDHAAVRAQQIPNFLDMTPR